MIPEYNSWESPKSMAKSRGNTFLSTLLLLYMSRDARKGPLARLSTKAIKRRGSLTRQTECIAISRDTYRYRYIDIHACILLARFSKTKSVTVYPMFVCF